jgi:hypothetical protein
MDELRNQNIYILLYSGAEKQGEQGVGFVVKRSLENSIIGFEPINKKQAKTHQGL